MTKQVEEVVEVNPGRALQRPCHPSPLSLHRLSFLLVHDITTVSCFFLLSVVLSDLHDFPIIPLEDVRRTWPTKQSQSSTVMAGISSLISSVPVSRVLVSFF